jgi:two-component sensor histidine kinase
VTTFNPGQPASEVRTLLRELNHRIDSQLAAAIELISVDAVRAEGAEAKAALSGAAELLHGHAGVHRALLMPRRRTLIDAAAYVRKLGRALRRAVLDRLSIQLTLEGDRLPLQPERCWRLGLIIHELVTNATKHESFDRRPREICIKLVCTDELISCIVSDNGSAATRAREGLGLRIVRDLARSLGGRMERGSGSGSVVVSFALTARERQAICAIDARRSRRGREAEAAASEARRRREAASLPGQARRRLDVSRPLNGPPAHGGEQASRRSTDALGELLSSSHRMETI